MPARSLDLNHDQDGKRNQTPQLNHSYHRCGSRQMFAVHTIMQGGIHKLVTKNIRRCAAPGPWRNSCWEKLPPSHT